MLNRVNPGRILLVDKIKGGAIPREFIKPCKEGIEIGSQNGVLAGYPVTDFIATLVDGSYHDVDSDEISFQLAAKYAIKDAFRKAGSVFMEPIMKLEIVVPEDYWGNVTGNLMNVVHKSRKPVTGANLKRPWWMFPWQKCLATRMRCGLSRRDDAHHSLWNLRFTRRFQTALPRK